MDLNERCYSLVKRVPKGKVTTYKEIALKLNLKAYRLVGKIMKLNHDKKVPCHRVVCSNGNVGGFNRGKKEKIKILKKEGVIVKNEKIDLKKFGFKL